MKHFRLSVIILVSSACVAASTAHSGNLLMMIAPLLGKKNSSSYGDMNTVTKLISVSSGNSDSLTADWLPSQDEQTPASQIRYTLHVSTDEDFLPSAATAKGSVVGKETLTVTGLEPDTQYFVLVAAADGSGNESWSNRLQARTVAAAAVRTSAVVEVQTESQNPTVTADTVSYTSDKLPAAGEYLMSSVGDGYLRKVVSATSAAGVVTAQTEDASLNEVLEQYEISTTVKLASLPASSSSAPVMMRAADGSGQMPARQHRWEKSGLLLKDSNQDTASSRIVSTASGKLVAASSYIPFQIATGQYSIMSGPAYLATSPGATLNDTVKVNVASQGEQICKIVLSEFTHDDSTLAKLPPPKVIQTISSDKKSGSLELRLSPSDSYIDSKNRPYKATVKAYINATSQGCDNVIWWDDEPEMNIPVYIEHGRLEIEKEKKAVTFTGDFKITNEAEMTFEPDLKIDVKKSLGNIVESADLIASANIGLINTLTIEATGEGDLAPEPVSLLNREFVKLILLGGEIPVMVRGVFNLNARINGHIGGAANLTKSMELSFPNTSFGMQYRDGEWQTVTNFQPDYTFHIDGEANADADITLTLIPDLQIHLYEIISGRMILEPSLYAKAGLHGQFKYKDADLNDLDYWFTYLNAGVALDMRLYANLHVFDKNIASWPKDVSPTETDKFNPYNLITKDDGKMYALPTLEGVINDMYDDYPDSRAINIKGISTDYITPFFGWNLNPFQKWTEPKVITDLPDSAYDITSLDETSLFPYWWFIPKQAGDFTVRLGGYSKLGWFVRQVAEVPLSLPDADADGLPDYWENRFGITDAGGDDDSDGLDNAAEFSYGTSPTNADSDGGGTSDGQEIADGTNPLDSSDDISHAVAVLTASGGSVTEGNNGTKQLEFTLSLDQFYGTASVDYTTKDGTATTAGNDYVADSGTVTFLGGSTSEKVSITVNGDTDVEPDETFSLQLSNPVNLTLANSSATGMIVDDDSSGATGTLNDTGITWSGNYKSGNNTACVASTLPDGDNVVAAQDCSHGRDATHNDDSDGHAGFSYTKLDSNGVPLDDQSADYATTPWACVKDNVTGLIWEVKTDDGGLHDKYDEYTWYNTDPTTNGGADGYADDGACCYGYNSTDSSTFCNTQAYVNRVNAAGWCGASDWRMPTRKELNSIVHRGRYLPAIDIGYFPNTRSYPFWSGSPGAGSSSTAWNVSFSHGLSGSSYRDSLRGFAVRLVRSEQ